MAVVDLLNSTTMQTLLYAAFVFVFQMLTETLRNPKLEFYFDKMMKDTIVVSWLPPSHSPNPNPNPKAHLGSNPNPNPEPNQENHFDSSHNVFEDIRRTADIYEWGNYVLWPGLLGNMGPFDEVGRPGERTGPGLSWPDGDGSFHGEGATDFTVPELVERMDQLDWTDGVYLRQARVADTPSEECHTQQLAGTCLPEMDSASVGVMDESRHTHTRTHTHTHMDACACVHTRASTRSSSCRTAASSRSCPGCSAGSTRTRTRWAPARRSGPSYAKSCGGARSGRLGWALRVSLHNITQFGCLINTCQ